MASSESFRPAALFVFLFAVSVFPLRGQVAGTVDPAFNLTMADDYVLTTAVQPDGKIPVSGIFSNIGGLSHADALLLILEDQPADSAATKTAKAALRAKFVAYELPEDFVEDLRTDRDAIRETNKHNQGETQDGVEDTARIGQILALAAEDVQGLDAIMHNKYTRDATKLAAWRSASRVERAPLREKNPAVSSSGKATP